MITLRKTIKKAYNSIKDLPIINFNEVITKNNLKYLIIEGKHTDAELTLIWSNIYNEFINEFGLPENYKSYLRLKIKWSKEVKRVWIDGEIYRQAFADIYEEQANNLLTGIESNLGKTIAQVSESMGFRVNPKETTVYEFYNYINHLNEKSNG